MAFLNLFRTKKVQIIKRDPLRITMSEWRSSQELTRLAQSVLQDRSVRQMLDILHHNQMGKWAISPTVSLEERAVRSALCEGYVLALNDFENLAVYQKPAKEIEATFAADNIDPIENL
jgi:hypothetical protein